MSLQFAPDVAGSQMQSFLSLWTSALRFFSLSLEIFFRKNFGDRYFNLGALVAVGVILYVYTNVFCLVQITASAVILRKTTLPIHLFTYAVITAGIVQLWLIYKRNKREERIYSWYSGDSFLSSLPVSPHVLQMYIEPGLAFVIGHYFIQDMILSDWVEIASISMFLVRRQEWSKLENFIHDTLDREIETKYLQEAVLERQSPDKTEKFFVASSLHYPKISKETLQSAMERLDPGLKELMEKNQKKDSSEEER